MSPPAPAPAPAPVADRAADTLLVLVRILGAAGGQEERLQATLDEAGERLGTVLARHHWPGDGAACDATLPALVRRLERHILAEVLKRSGGNMAAVARTLGLTPRQVRYKIRRLKIPNPRTGHDLA
jgi:transcriptional regulator with GAF, ATPase, and Fis domain